MANEYTNAYGSQFPSSIMKAMEFKDITNEISPKIKIAEGYINTNDYKSANAYIEREDLDPYLINAEKLNLIVEEIRNTQIYAKTKGQQIVYVDSTDDFPNSPVDGDIYRVKIER